MDTRGFVALVREFVRVIDEADWSRPHAVLMKCAQVLPRIYAGGLDLPEVVPTEKDIQSSVGRPHFDFGRYDRYWEVFDPYVHEEAVMGSLADDLGDVYVDLVRPLMAFDAGFQADAIWNWKFNIRGHCGDHLVDALRAIHRLVNDHMAFDYDPKGDDSGQFAVR